MKLTTRFLFSLGIFTGAALLALSCGDSHKSDESGGVAEAGTSGMPQGGSTQGGTNGTSGTGNESGEGGSVRGGSGGSAGAPRGGSSQGGDPGAGGEGGSNDGDSGSGAGGEGGDPSTGGSAGAMAGGGMGGMAGVGMAGSAGTLGGAGTAGAAGTGGMAGTGGGPPPGCFRIEPLSWVRTLYPDYTPYPWGMQDGAMAITVARYNWVGWFEYDVGFPSTGNFRITVRTADDGWHEGLTDELYNHFSVGVAGTTRLDFDANVSPYDDGAVAVGDLGFHDATGPVFAATAGSQVVRFDNIADRWIDGDDIQMHIAYIQICSVP